jgi:hypothetical protein
MNDDPRSIALAYIEACGRKDWAEVARLLAPAVQFTGPARSVTGAEPYLAVLRRIGSVWVRSDVKKVFSDGPEVCVIYDFVSDTPAGAVPAVEWLRVQEGRIASVTLFFDRVTFAPASEEVVRRMGEARL